MFRFADPFYFFLLIPGALAAWFVYRRHVRAGLLFAPVARLPARSGSWRVLASTLLPILSLSGLALCVVALARPQTVFSTIRNTSNAIAIEMITDTSGSMEALDMSDIAGNRILKERTRLDAVKETFSDFVKKRPDDLIGLVTFAGYASTRAPLTADHDALRHVLKGVEVPTPVAGQGGVTLNQEEMLTAIGDALATACARLEHVELKSKIVVLLSDGKSNTGIISPKNAMELAKKMDIKVYTIGVGSSGRAPFRTQDMFGRSVIGFGAVEMDETLLRDIAETTGGRYFNVKNPKGLEQAMEAIDKLEKTKTERDVYNQYSELFPRFLMPGLSLLVLGTALSMLVLRKLF